MKNKQVNISSLVLWAMFLGQFEERLKSFIKDTQCLSREVILFVVSEYILHRRFSVVGKLLSSFKHGQYLQVNQADIHREQSGTQKGEWERTE